MTFSRISEKGQITLPRKVRQALQVKPGDRVLFVVEDQSVRLQPLTTSSACALAGSLRHYATARSSRPPRSLVKEEVARAAAQEG